MTDEIIEDPVYAGKRLGIPTPKRIIPIIDNNHFRGGGFVAPTPNRGYIGGGTQFFNRYAVPAKDILKAIELPPISGGPPE